MKLTASFSIQARVITTSSSGHTTHKKSLLGNVLATLDLNKVLFRTKFSAWYNSPHTEKNVSTSSCVLLWMYDYCTYLQLLLTTKGSCIDTYCFRRYCSNRSISGSGSSNDKPASSSTSISDKLASSSGSSSDRISRGVSGRGSAGNPTITVSLAETWA